MKKKFLFLFAIFLMFNLFGQQQINKTLFFDGQNRNYIIYIPASYNGSVNYPVLFSFHGGGGTSNYHLNNVTTRSLQILQILLLFIHKAL